MENKSNISLGGTIILLALFAQRSKDTFWVDPLTQSVSLKIALSAPKKINWRKYTPLYKKVKIKPKESNGDYSQEIEMATKNIKTSWMLYSNVLQLI